MRIYTEQCIDVCSMRKLSHCYIFYRYYHFKIFVNKIYNIKRTISVKYFFKKISKERGCGQPRRVAIIRSVAFIC